jgi:hypothetical protein
VFTQAAPFPAPHLTIQPAGGPPSPSAKAGREPAAGAEGAHSIQVGLKRTE